MAIKMIWVLTYSVRYETQCTFLGAWETKPHLNTLKKFMPHIANDTLKLLKKSGHTYDQWGAEYELVRYKLGEEYK